MSTTHDPTKVLAAKLAAKDIVWQGDFSCRLLHVFLTGAMGLPYHRQGFGKNWWNVFPLESPYKLCDLGCHGGKTERGQLIQNQTCKEPSLFIPRSSVFR